MKGKKRQINGLLILTIIAATIWYSNYIYENPFMNKQLEAFSYFGRDTGTSDYQKTSAQSKFGYMRPQVVHGFTEEPIEGAVVVIPAIKASFKTNEDGYTPNIKIEISPDGYFEEIHPKTWGETVLIAYKEGYIEYVLLHVNVWENENRKGPKILLFPKNDGSLDQPMSIVEGPNQLWINSLVEKYRP